MSEVGRLLLSQDSVAEVLASLKNVIGDTL